jgi:hypothetical protein
MFTVQKEKHMGKDDKAKFRVFFGEIEGDNETIRDGLKSIAVAVNRTFSTETRVVRLPAPKNGNDEELAVDETVVQPELGDLTELDVQQDKKTRRSKKPLSYSFVKDLNLQPTGTVSLRDFFASKATQTQQEQITVILHYLTKTLELGNVGPNHIYTALKDVDVQVPADIGAVIRNSAFRKNWIDSSNSDDLKLTVAGENFVEHDLEKRKGS